MVDWGAVEYRHLKFQINYIERSRQMTTVAGNRGGAGYVADEEIGAKGSDVQLPSTVLGEQSLAADLARAEIDQAIATAHRYPRQLDTVIKKIGTLACYNDAAAENCIYSLPRGGKPIIGASIGFANIVASSWGNCTDGARIVHIDRHEKTIVAEGGFHDLETNRKTIVPVQRRIVDRQGRLFSDDMIMVTGMAAASIARRNAILNAVPRALWFPIYEQALQIVRGTVETFAERKAKAIQAFAQFGVKPEQIYMALGLKGDPDLTLEHIAPMRGMYQALRDGSTTVEEMFDPRRMTGTAFEKVANPLGEDEPNQAVDPKTGEIWTAAAHKERVRQDKIQSEMDRGPAKETVDPKTGEIKPKRGRPVKKKNEPPPATLAETRALAEKLGVRSEEPAPVARADIPLKPAPDTAQRTGELPSGQVVPVARNVAEYYSYARAWLAAAQNATALEERWMAEKNLRGQCSVIGEDLDKIFEVKVKRVKALESTAAAGPVAPASQ
jgi:hypothetical protein